MSGLTPPAPAFIVSLRNNPNNDGVPGDRFGPNATYMLKVVPNGDPNDQCTYSLKDDVGSGTWANKLAGTAANGPILIFVHGFDNLAPKVVTRYIAVQSGMVNAGGKVTVVCFDWPTSGANDYKGDQEKAITSGHELRDIFLVLKQAGIDFANIHILTHSMGGYVVQNAFDITNLGPKIGHVLMAEADVQELAFDISFATPPTSALGCFMSWPSHLTVYWSSDDAALKFAKIYNRFVGPCGAPSPQSLPDATRLGFVGLSSKTLSLPSYSAQLSNVGYAGYYEAQYVNTTPPPTPKPDAQDSHVWPILGTRAFPRPSGDQHFMTDVWEVVNSAKTYTYRNPSTPSNNYMFKTQPR